MEGIQIAFSQEENLDPLAQKSIFAKRLHPLIDEDDKSACRSPFARDRDRILFCKPFRRLAHKTQLYISDEGNEHNRTRLTHTIEVAQIAKTIAHNLSMNIDLVEAIAYGHDIGHSPFGHAGENQINRFLKGKEPFPGRVKDKIKTDTRQAEDIEGDFRHNYQSIRILTVLENYHPDYEGMNLTNQCLEGILKHTSINPKDDPGRKFNFPGKNDEKSIFSKLDCDKEYSVTIEGQIVSLADEIAQVTHDINDALRIDAISFDTLWKNPSIQKIIQSDKMRYPGTFQGCKNSKAKLQAQINSIFCDYFTRYIINRLKEAIDRIPKHSMDRPFKATDWLLPENKINDKAFLYLQAIKEETILNNFTVNRMDSKGQYIIRHLFNGYFSNPRQLPDSILESYCQTKKKEIIRLREDGFKNWLRKKKDQYIITGNLGDSELDEIVSFIRDERDGHEFRLLPHTLIDNLIPYFSIDSDFVRSVTDCIASMTDRFAKEEYEKLYL
jgi:dGTPase